MWISFFMVVFSLRLFPLDCFIPSSGSSGALGRAQEQNIRTSCIETRIRINCLSNTATNESSPNPSERGQSSSFHFTDQGEGGRYSHEDTREGKVLAQGHIASFWVTWKQWHIQKDLNCWRPKMIGNSWCLRHPAVPLHSKWLPYQLPRGGEPANQCMLSRVWLFATAWTVAPARQLCPWNFPGKNTGVGWRWGAISLNPRVRQEQNASVYVWVESCLYTLINGCRT